MLTRGRQTGNQRWEDFSQEVTGAEGGKKQHVVREGILRARLTKALHDRELHTYPKASQSHGKMTSRGLGGYSLPRARSNDGLWGEEEVRYPGKGLKDVEVAWTPCEETGRAWLRHRMHGWFSTIGLWGRQSRTLGNGDSEAIKLPAPCQAMGCWWIIFLFYKGSIPPSHQLEEFCNYHDKTVPLLMSYLRVRDTKVQLHLSTAVGFQCYLHRITQNPIQGWWDISALF